MNRVEVGIKSKKYLSEKWSRPSDSDMGPVPGPAAQVVPRAGVAADNGSQ